MASIATGSPLIRIMVKSIAGVALGGWRPGVGEREGGFLFMLQCARLESTPPAPKHSSHLLKENRDSPQKSGEDCGDKVGETGRDKGGKQ